MFQKYGSKIVKPQMYIIQMYYIDHYIIDTDNPLQEIEQSYTGLKNQITHLIKSQILKRTNTNKKLAFLEFIINNHEQYKEWKEITISISKQWEERCPNNPIIQGLLIHDLEKYVESIFNEIWSFTPSLDSLLSGKLPYLGK